ncbi:hypothetical protein BJ965_004618 [Streptomyces luteogriseus]|uniref:Uncharacterized protein n=1 Tax=Streptomyces luteogriseus TaxID=68233 RepID=A0A7W7GI52_9ACTN|nr:hypothetical protein [Streptomyces luteogriseus]
MGLMRAGRALIGVAVLAVCLALQAPELLPALRS